MKNPAPKLLTFKVETFARLPEEVLAELVIDQLDAVRYQKPRKGLAPHEYSPARTPVAAFGFWLQALPTEQLGKLMAVLFEQPKEKPEKPAPAKSSSKGFNYGAAERRKKPAAKKPRAKRAVDSKLAAEPKVDVAKRNREETAERNEKALASLKTNPGVVADEFRSSNGLTEGQAKRILNDGIKAGLVHTRKTDGRTRYYAGSAPTTNGAAAAAAGGE